MLEEKSFDELREAIHSLAQAIALIPEIYVPQGDKTKGLAAKIFSDLLKEVLARTSRRKEAEPGNHSDSQEAQ